MDCRLKNVCFIYGNRSRPIWFLSNEKKPHYSFPAEQALIMQYPWISVNSRQWLETWITATVSVTESAITGRTYISLKRSGKQRGIDCFDHDGWEINYAHATHQLFLLSLQPVVLKVFQAPKKNNLTVNNLEMPDFTSRGPCMSAVTQWQGQKPICQNHQSPTLQTSFTCQLKLFFTSDICVGFPSCP